MCAGLLRLSKNECHDQHVRSGLLLSTNSHQYGLMCAFRLGAFQKLCGSLQCGSRVLWKTKTTRVQFMRRGACSAGWILNALEWDIMLGTGHKRCINTSSRSSGFLFSITSTFLLLISKNEPEEFMLAPALPFQNARVKATCALSLLSSPLPAIKKRLQLIYGDCEPYPNGLQKVPWRALLPALCIQSIHPTNHGEWRCSRWRIKSSSASSFYLFIPTLSLYFTKTN